MLRVTGVLGVLTAVVLWGGVAAQETPPDWSGSYVCQDEFGGGIRYNEATKGWGATTFRPEGRFVLSLSKTGERKPWEDIDLLVGTYDVNISQFGHGTPSACLGMNGNQEVVVGWIGLVACTDGVTEYRINLENMRFLAAYPWGFVDGIENNENTPSMMGGTCAKID